MSARALAGKRVLITGGSRGLGLVLARKMAEKGARVAICARSVLELEAAARLLAARGLWVETYVCDLEVPIEIDGLFKSLEADWGGIDILVNNAGIIQVGPEANMEEKEYRQILGVNFWPLVLATQKALPGMRARGWGRIVNIASIGGMVPLPHLAPYSAAKFAAYGYSQTLQIELAHTGVRVTTVVPGLLRTGSYMRALYKGQRPRELGWFSLGATLPGFTMSAERAARRIVRACARGERHVVLGIPAKVGRVVYALFPTLTGVLLSWVSRRLLPPETDAAETRSYAGPGYLYRDRLIRPSADPYNQRSGT